MRHQRGYKGPMPSPSVISWCGDLKLGAVAVPWSATPNPRSPYCGARHVHYVERAVYCYGPTRKP
jgi:hypothetical protein